MRGCRATHPELLSKVGITLLGRNCHGERDQVKPAADSLVDRSERWLVVAGDDKLEGWTVLEEVLAHKPRSDRVGSRELLDA